MTSHRILPLLSSIALAFLITVAVYFFDARNTRLRNADFGLRLARQIAAQVQALTTQAREHGQSDALLSAIRDISVGAEDRPIHLAPLQTNQELPENEKYRLKPDTGVFSYYKVLDQEHSEGIRLHIQLGYTGFLGASTHFENDFYLLLIFLLSTIAAMHLVNLLERRGKPDVDEQVLLAKKVSIWASEARSTLMQLGIHIRDLIQHAKTLSVAVARSREKVEAFVISSPQVDGESLGPALESYKEVYQLSQELSTIITLTRETLMSEAKMMQQLKFEILPPPTEDQEAS